MLTENAVAGDAPLKVQRQRSAGQKPRLPSPAQLQDEFGWCRLLGKTTTSAYIAGRKERMCFPHVAVPLRCDEYDETTSPSTAGGSPIVVASHIMTRHTG